MSSIFFCALISTCFGSIYGSSNPDFEVERVHSPYVVQNDPGPMMTVARQSQGSKTYGYHQSRDRPLYQSGIACPSCSPGYTSASASASASAGASLSAGTGEETFGMSTGHFGTLAYPVSSLRHELKQKQEFINGQKVYNLHHEKRFEDGRLVHERRSEQDDKDGKAKTENLPSAQYFREAGGSSGSHSGSRAHIPPGRYPPYSGEYSHPSQSQTYATHGANFSYESDLSRSFEDEVKRLRDQMKHSSVDYQSRVASPGYFPRGESHRTEFRTQTKYINGMPVYVRRDERKYKDGVLIHNKTEEKSPQELGTTHIAGQLHEFRPQHSTYSSQLSEYDKTVEQTSQYLGREPAHYYPAVSASSSSHASAYARHSPDTYFPRPHSPESGVGQPSSDIHYVRGSYFPRTSSNTSYSQSSSVVHKAPNVPASSPVNQFEHVSADFEVGSGSTSRGSGWTTRANQQQYLSSASGNTQQSYNYAIPSYYYTTAATTTTPGISPFNEYSETYSGSIHRANHAVEEGSQQSSDAFYPVGNKPATYSRSYFDHRNISATTRDSSNRFPVYSSYHQPFSRSSVYTDDQSFSNSSHIRQIDGTSSNASLGNYVPSTVNKDYPSATLPKKITGYSSGDNPPHSYLINNSVRQNLPSTDSSIAAPKPQDTRGTYDYGPAEFGEDFSDSMRIPQPVARGKEEPERYDISPYEDDSSENEFSSGPRYPSYYSPFSTARPNHTVHRQDSIHPMLAGDYTSASTYQKSRSQTNGHQPFYYPVAEANASSSASYSSQHIAHIPAGRTETKTTYKYINGHLISITRFNRYFEGNTLIHENFTEKSRNELEAEGTNVASLDLTNAQLVEYGHALPVTSSHSQRYELTESKRFVNGQQVYGMHHERRFQDGKLVGENRTELNEDDLNRQHAHQPAVQASLSHELGSHSYGRTYMALPDSYSQKHEVRQEQEFRNGHKVYDFHREREFEDGKLIHENKTEHGTKSYGHRRMPDGDFQKHHGFSDLPSSDFDQTDSHQLSTTCVTCTFIPSNDFRTYSMNTGEYSHGEKMLIEQYPHQPVPQREHSYGHQQEVEEHYDNGRLVHGREEKKEWKDGEMVSHGSRSYSHESPLETAVARAGSTPRTAWDGHCYPGMCKNDGACTETGHGAYCICKFAYRGYFCQELYCPQSYCRRRGVCSVRDEKLHCRCPSAYQTHRCMKPSKPA